MKCCAYISSVGQVFDFVNNQWIPFTLIFQNQRTSNFSCFSERKKSESKNHHFWLFQNPKKARQFFDLFRNCWELWLYMGNCFFCIGEEMCFFLLDFSYFYSSWFSHFLFVVSDLKCCGSTKLCFTNHLWVSKVIE